MSTTLFKSNKPAIYDLTMSLEDDVYNDIFTALKHPIRRKILKSLENNPHTYTELLNELELETGLLNYHLENLKTLIRKDEGGKYAISIFGRAALSLTRRIEEPAREKLNRVSLFGKCISWNKMFILVIGFLLLTNVYTIASYQGVVSSGAERFGENVVFAQGRMINVLSDLRKIIEGGLLHESSLGELQYRVEAASLQFAKVTYLDERHPDMWDYASRALWTLSDLIGDTRVAVSAVNSFEAGVALDSDSVKRLDDVNNSLNELYDALFPPGTSESNNPWAVASYSAMDRVIGKVEALRSSVGKAWLIVPHLQGAAPLEQSSKLLVETVGEAYFSRYFSYPRVEYNTWEPKDWLTRVTYSYFLRVGSYNETVEVYLYYSKLNVLIRTEGVPASDSLMPYNVTKERALEVAVSRVSPGYGEVDVGFHFISSSNSSLRVGRYVWGFDFYRSPRGALSGSLTRVLMDPYSGEVVSIEDICWTSSS